MTHKRYTAFMQRFYEGEVMAFLDNLPDKMVRRHAQLTKGGEAGESSPPEQVRQIWKRRLDYVWLKFLLNEQELKAIDTEHN